MRGSKEGQPSFLVKVLIGQHLEFRLIVAGDRAVWRCLVYRATLGYCCQRNPCRNTVQIKDKGKEKQSNTGLPTGTFPCIEGQICPSELLIYIYFPFWYLDRTEDISARALSEPGT